MFYFSKKVRLFSQNDALFLFYFLINPAGTTGLMNFLDGTKFSLSFIYSLILYSFTFYPSFAKLLKKNFVVTHTRVNYAESRSAKGLELYINKDYCYVN